ncbi:MAG: metallophosphoesterase [Spirochaetaceae bacterium]|nr:metallophosphoesterase [Spirochaetaceae bacterium]
MFLLIIILYLIYLASFLYIAQCIIFVFKIPRPPAYYLYALCIVLCLFSIVSFIGRRADHGILRLITPFSFIVMGIWAITISCSLINELTNLIAYFFKTAHFRYYSTLITLGLSAVFSLWSLVNAAVIQRVNEITIPVQGLGRPSLRIIQLSDIHINAATSISKITRIFEKAAALHGDIIVLTGDIFDSDILHDESYKRFGFEKLSAPGGVYAVTGNHDYYTGISIFNELCKQCNITVLDDDSIMLDDIINIAGINDISFRSSDMITIALSDIDSHYPVLFLSHRPESFDHIAAINDKHIVQLSGHTHGGQIPPIEIIRRFFMKYNTGIYSQKNARMFVSSGTRWWGPPMRFGNTCEIAVINLHAANG